MKTFFVDLYAFMLSRKTQTCEYIKHRLDYYLMISPNMIIGFYFFII